MIGVCSRSMGGIAAHATSWLLSALGAVVRRACWVSAGNIARGALIVCLTQFPLQTYGGEPLHIPDLPLGAASNAAPANVLIDLSVTYADAGAAYRDAYQPGLSYAGYFNSALCYDYPLSKAAGATASVPDLSERTGYFAPAGNAGPRHDCKGAFSGNFLNWASTSTIDLLRYALTGGDRVADTGALTILQRAWLPDGAFHTDFYAHPVLFPRKVIGAGTAASVTPFSSDTLYIVSCRNRILFSNTDKGGSCDVPRNSDAKLKASDRFFGEYNVRVKVCGADDAALRPDLCTGYGAAFKPEGVLQAAMQQIGVMGYLSQSAAGAPAPQGGVLRAPIKSLRETTTSAPAFAPVPNPYAEVNPRNGVLLPDPDAASTGTSGAINYINRLGRATAARAGAYPSADPGAELYYDSVRYLQNRAAATVASGDGQPVWSAPADPVALACQRTTVAMIGHSAFTDDRYVPGNTQATRHDPARASDRFALTELDVMAATRRVGQLEADAGGTPRADLLNLAMRDDGPTGAGSFYLGGAAYWAHTNPIRRDRPVHIDTIVLELGTVSGVGRSGLRSALYYAAKYGAFDDRNGDANPFITTDERRDNSEWRGVDGEPAHYVAAADAHAIIPGVRQLFNGIGADAGLKPGPTAMASRGGARFLIETGYDASSWSGSVRRRNLTVSADGEVTLAATPVWEAQTLLDGAIGKPPLPRQLFTLATDADGITRTVPFDWGSLLPEQRALLDTVTRDGPADGRGAARLAWLRGARDGEGADGLRRRTSVLGDIVHSTPLVVAPPSLSVQGEGYGDFLARYKRRRGVAYVGANDGVLHAFDVVDGRELFGYVPHALLPDLARLTAPAYRHRPYVDASAGQGEATIGGRWRSVLASGMGMGARGLFALDITDPAAFDSGLGALWEFTEADDAAIGHVMAPPQIARLRNGVRDGKPLYRYFVVVSSGINPANADGTGALFLLALDKSATDKWRIGVNYFKIGTAGGAAASATVNVLSPPVLAIGADGSARHAYAGDLHGRLWRFTFGSKPSSGNLSVPLFVARDSAGSAQPISHAPALVFAPGGGYLVLAGTGKYMEQTDTLPASFTPQSFYAIHDSLADPVTGIGGRAALAPRTLSGTGPYIIRGAPLVYAGAEAKQGWYVDFPITAIDGERLAGPATVRSGSVVFHTVLPGIDPCLGPSSRTYAMDALSGFAFNSGGVAEVNAASGELAGPAETYLPPLLMEIAVSSDDRNPTGGATAIRTVAVVHLNRGGKAGRDGAAAKAAAVQQIKVASRARRFSWREVANWQELHDAVKK